MNTGPSSAASEDFALWSVRGLLARHKLAALGVTVVIAGVLAVIVVALLSSKAVAVGDATTCSTWGSANQDQQAAYARLYLREHGPARDGVSPASVIAAINRGCDQAYTDDVSDNTTVVQAISGNF